MSELAWGSHVPLSLTFEHVYTLFIQLESLGITVQYPEYILISGTSLCVFQMTASII